MSPMKYYRMLQNTRVTVFTVSELLRVIKGKPTGRGGITPPESTNPQSFTKYLRKIRVSMWNSELREKVQFPFFRRFLLAVTKLSFWYFLTS